MTDTNFGMSSYSSYTFQFNEIQRFEELQQMFDLLSNIISTEELNIQTIDFIDNSSIHVLSILLTTNFFDYETHQIILKYFDFTINLMFLHSERNFVESLLLFFQTYFPNLTETFVSNFLQNNGLSKILQVLKNNRIDFKTILTLSKLLYILKIERKVEFDTNQYYNLLQQNAIIQINLSQNYNFDEIFEFNKNTVFDGNETTQKEQYLIFLMKLKFNNLILEEIYRLIHNESYLMHVYSNIEIFWLFLKNTMKEEYKDIMILIIEKLINFNIINASFLSLFFKDDYFSNCMNIYSLLNFLLSILNSLSDQFFEDLYYIVSNDEDCQQLWKYALQSFAGTKIIERIENLKRQKEMNQNVINKYYSQEKITSNEISKLIIYIKNTFINEKSEENGNKLVIDEDILYQIVMISKKIIFDDFDSFMSVLNILTDYSMTKNQKIKQPLLIYYYDLIVFRLESNAYYQYFFNLLSVLYNLEIPVFTLLELSKNAVCKCFTTQSFLEITRFFDFLLENNKIDDKFVKGIFINNLAQLSLIKEIEHLVILYINDLIEKYDESFFELLYSSQFFDQNETILTKFSIFKYPSKFNHWRNNINQGKIDPFLIPLYLNDLKIFLSSYLEKQQFPEPFEKETNDQLLLDFLKLLLTDSTNLPNQDENNSKEQSTSVDEKSNNNKDTIMNSIKKLQEILPIIEIFFRITNKYNDLSMPILKLFFSKSVNSHLKSASFRDELLTVFLNKCDGFNLLAKLIVQQGKDFNNVHWIVSIIATFLCKFSNKKKKIIDLKAIFNSLLASCHNFTTNQTLKILSVLNTKFSSSRYSDVIKSSTFDVLLSMLEKEQNNQASPNNQNEQSNETTFDNEQISILKYILSLKIDDNDFTEERFMKFTKSVVFRNSDMLYILALSDGFLNNGCSPSLLLNMKNKAQDLQLMYQFILKICGQIGEKVHSQFYDEILEYSIEKDCPMLYFDLNIKALVSNPIQFLQKIIPFIRQNTKLIVGTKFFNILLEINYDPSLFDILYKLFIEYYSTENIDSSLFLTFLKMQIKPSTISNQNQNMNHDKNIHINPSPSQNQKSIKESYYYLLTKSFNFIHNNDKLVNKILSDALLDPNCKEKWITFYQYITSKKNDQQFINCQETISNILSTNSILNQTLSEAYSTFTQNIINTKSIFEFPNLLESWKKRIQSAKTFSDLQPFLKDLNKSLSMMNSENPSQLPFQPFQHTFIQHILNIILNDGNIPESFINSVDKLIRNIICLCIKSKNEENIYFLRIFNDKNLLFFKKYPKYLEDLYFAFIITYNAENYFNFMLTEGIKKSLNNFLIILTALAFDLQIYATKFEKPCEIISMEAVMSNLSKIFYSSSDLDFKSLFSCFKILICIGKNDKTQKEIRKMEFSIITDFTNRGKKKESVFLHQIWELIKSDQLYLECFNSQSTKKLCHVTFDLKTCDSITNIFTLYAQSSQLEPEKLIFLFEMNVSNENKSQYFSFIFNILIKFNENTLSQFLTNILLNSYRIGRNCYEFISDLSNLINGSEEMKEFYIKVEQFLSNYLSNQELIHSKSLKKSLILLYGQQIQDKSFYLHWAEIVSSSLIECADQCFPIIIKMNISISTTGKLYPPIEVYTNHYLSFLIQILEQILGSSIRANFTIFRELFDSTINLALFLFESSKDLQNEITQIPFQIMQLVNTNHPLFQNNPELIHEIDIIIMSNEFKLKMKNIILKQSLPFFKRVIETILKHKIIFDQNEIIELIKDTIIDKEFQITDFSDLLDTIKNLENESSPPEIKQVFNIEQIEKEVFNFALETQELPMRLEILLFFINRSDKFVSTFKNHSQSFLNSINSFKACDVECILHIISKILILTNEVILSLFSFRSHNQPSFDSILEILMNQNGPDTFSSFFSYVTNHLSDIPQFIISEVLKYLVATSKFDQYNVLLEAFNKFKSLNDTSVKYNSVVSTASTLQTKISNIPKSNLISSNSALKAKSISSIINNSSLKTVEENTLKSNPNPTTPKTCSYVTTAKLNISRASSYIPTVNSNKHAISNSSVSTSPATASINNTNPPRTISTLNSNAPLVNIPTESLANQKTQPIIKKTVNLNLQKHKTNIPITSSYIPTSNPNTPTKKCLPQSATLNHSDLRIPPANFIHTNNTNNDINPSNNFDTQEIHRKNLLEMITSSEVNLTKIYEIIKGFKKKFSETFTQQFLEKLSENKENCIRLFLLVDNKSLIPQNSNIDSIYANLKKSIYEQIKMPNETLPLPYEDIIWKYIIYSPRIMKLLIKLYCRNDGDKLSDEVMISKFLDNWYSHYLSYSSISNDLNNPFFGRIIKMLKKFVKYYETNMFRDNSIFPKILNTKFYQESSIVSLYNRFENKFTHKIFVSKNSTLESVIQAYSSQVFIDMNSIALFYKINNDKTVPDNVEYHTDSQFLGNDQMLKRNCKIKHLKNLQLEVKKPPTKVKSHIRTCVPSNLIISQSWYDTLVNNHLENSDNELYRLIQYLPIPSSFNNKSTHLEFNLDKLNTFSYHLEICLNKKIILPDFNELMHKIEKLERNTFIIDKILSDFLSYSLFLIDLRILNHHSSIILKDVLFLIALKGYKIKKIEKCMINLITSDSLLISQKVPLDLLFNQSKYIQIFAKKVFQQFIIPLKDFLTCMDSNKPNLAFLSVLSHHLTNKYESSDIENLCIRVISMIPNSTKSQLKAVLNLISNMLKASFFTDEQEMTILNILIEEFIVSDNIEENDSYPSALDCVLLLAKYKNILHPVLLECAKNKETKNQMKRIEFLDFVKNLGKLPSQDYQDIVQMF
ncbi:hypothetical protein TRFO_03723 [Tritrichomonas foetus]|uniref:Uncharacterized protein n=1 Tax=Tritrichomonas foetus TaxID=1144522 RepID=A0A1J4KRL4_9EUKA|nr:hypothetical protein TRFO_03723 [Tritrichomonas foetus]|eukprot:OHT12101.1 hypothetical protein TRFO_03723 [Tritrichomonas foetus]